MCKGVDPSVGLPYGAHHLVTATFAQWQIWPVTDTWGVARGVVRYHVRNSSSDELQQKQKKAEECTLA